MLSGMHKVGLLGCLRRDRVGLDDPESSFKLSIFCVDQRSFLRGGHRKALGATSHLCRSGVDHCKMTAKPVKVAFFRLLFSENIPGYTHPDLLSWKVSPSICATFFQESSCIHQMLYRQGFLQDVSVHLSM